MGSKPFSLDAVDWKSIGRGCLVALAGALLAYMPLFAGFTYKFGDFDATPFVVAALGVIANIVRKWYSDNTNVDPTKPIA